MAEVSVIQDYYTKVVFECPSITYLGHTDSHQKYCEDFGPRTPAALPLSYFENDTDQ